MPNRSKQKCPVCKKTATPIYNPFCSQGCKDRDLLQWLGDGYRLPGPAADHEDSINVDDD
jgi:endogenous inhibitor of DNA gyrase (YacG/DUF329 family)